MAIATEALAQAARQVKVEESVVVQWTDNVRLVAEVCIVAEYVDGTYKKVLHSDPMSRAHAQAYADDFNANHSVDRVRAMVVECPPLSMLRERTLRLKAKRKAREQALEQLRSPALLQAMRDSIETARQCKSLGCLTEGRSILLTAIERLMRLHYFARCGKQSTSKTSEQLAQVIRTIGIVDRPTFRAIRFAIINGNTSAAGIEKLVSIVLILCVSKGGGR